MGTGVLLLGFVTLQRLAELALARRNTRRLLAAGGREACAGQYPWIVGFHATWLGTLWVVGVGADLVLGWTAVFAVLQGLRLWVLWSLGGRWTTRVIVVDEPLVRRGPYRALAHPNYVVVVGEVAVVPLALGEPLLAALGSLVHLPLIVARIRCEDRALAATAERRDATEPRILR